MKNIEVRDRIMLEKASRYYLARRIFLFLSLLTLFGSLAVLFVYRGPYGSTAMARQGFIGAFFWLFWTNSMHLQIRHIESIRHYLKAVR